MALLNKTSSEFADLVSIFLLDKLQNMDKVIIDNVDFNILMEDMKSKNIKPILLRYFLQLDTKERIDYKRIRSAFTNTGKSSTIRINGTKIDNKEKEGVMKKILKRALQMIIASNNISNDEMELLMENDYYEEILSEIKEEEK